MRLIFILAFLAAISTIHSQFYRGELEPRYSKKTPFRQQTEIPEPVFGIGHGNRRFNGDKSSREESPLSPFFGERREPGRRNSGREAGRDYEENGEDEPRFGGERRRPFGFGRRGSEDEEDGHFPREGHGFKRPRLPDPTEVKDRFDKEREGRKRERGRGGRDGEGEEGEDYPKRQRGGRGHEEEEEEERQDTKGEEAEDRRPQHPRRPSPRHRDSYEDSEPESHRQRRPHPQHEEDRERESDRSHDRDQETETIAETPSKVVGLNMQMVAGVYPKEKKGPVVEDVDKRGGRFVDKPDEREENKFFRGSESGEGENPNPDRSKEEHREHREHAEPQSKESGDRRSTRGDSGEVEKRGRGEESRESGESKSNEQPERKGPQGPPPGQAPPPPKPQIPPFPAFPKFPSFGNFQPFQPDFPTRSFGGNGGFAGGPWNPSGGPSGRQTAHREDVGSSEDRSGKNGRRVHQQDSSSAPSDNSSANDDSSERRNPAGDHSKEDERKRESENRQPEASRRPEHSESEEVPLGGVRDQTYSTPSPVQLPSSNKKEFPTPGRFVTNIRAKKSGEVLDATTAPPTTSTIPPTAITFPIISTTTPSSSSGIVLPTEAIVTKLRSIVNQRIKVA